MPIEHPFPTIQKQADVMVAIKGKNEFIIVEKNGYIAVDCAYESQISYLPDLPDKNRNQYSLIRECRGIKFDSQSGAIISRPYHKFFDLDATDETMFEKIDWNNPYVILHYLDGVMIVPIHINKQTLWTGALSSQGHAEDAKNFANGNIAYRIFVDDLLNKGLSPIFEWVSTHALSILKYPQNDLILTAIRNIQTGEYIGFRELQDLGTQWNIPVVEEFDVSLKGKEMIGYIRSFEDLKGVIIRFDNGNMIKIKTDYWIERKKVKNILSSEREVLKIILEDRESILLPYLDSTSAKSLVQYKMGVKQALEQQAKVLKTEIEQELLNAQGNYEKFVGKVRAKLGNYIGESLSEIINGGDACGFLTKLVVQSCDKQKSIETIRPFLQGIRWKREEYI